MSLHTHILHTRAALDGSYINAVKWMLKFWNDERIVTPMLLEAYQTSISSSDFETVEYCISIVPYDELIWCFESPRNLKMLILLVEKKLFSYAPFVSGDWIGWRKFHLIAYVELNGELTEQTITSSSSRWMHTKVNTLDTIDTLFAHHENLPMSDRRMNVAIFSWS